MKKKVLIIIAFLAACAAAVCAFLYINIWSNKASTASHYDGLSSEAHKIDSSESTIVTSEHVDTTDTIKKDSTDKNKKKALIPIDFDTLQNKNRDIYAWITIPNTVIDYPVLQNSTDDSFYLSHDEMGDYLFAGSIYSETLNSRDFNDRNTVLYGHNMNDGSMFAELHKFKDKDFFDNNRHIYIYTPTEKLTYEIFAAYTRDDQHILKTVDFSNDQAWKDYRDDVLNMRSMDALYEEGIQLKEDDKLLTLSTCTANDDYSRYIVQGVLRGREEG